MTSRWFLVSGLAILYGLPLFLLKGYYTVPALVTYALLAIAISVTDFVRYEIPDSLTAALLLCVVLFTFSDPDFFLRVIVGITLGGVIWVAGGVLFRRFGQEFIGIGDAKLLGVIAVWTGPISVPDVVLLASLGGILLNLVAGTKHENGIPFGPFLAYAGYVTLFLDPILIF